VDRRADLYSLGCVAYWLLTGRLVFEAKTPVEMVTRHVDDLPEPPSRFSELDVSPALDTIVLGCLAKKSHERPQDASELAARLTACAVEPAWTQERARHWWQVHLPQSARETWAPVSQEMTTLVRRSTPS
jgi:serine/threonine-protein kinase